MRKVSIWTSPAVAVNDIALGPVAADAREAQLVALSRLEEEIWAVVGRDGPSDALRDELAAMLGASPIDPRPGLSALAKCVTACHRREVDSTMLEHAAHDALRVATAVWDAFRDGFDSGWTAALESLEAEGEMSS